MHLHVKKGVGVVTLLAALLAALSMAAALPASKGTLGGKAYVFTLEDVNVLDPGYPSGVVQVAVSYLGTYTLLGSTMQLSITCGDYSFTTNPVELGSWRPGTQKTVRFTVDTSRLNSSCKVRVLISWSDSWDDAFKSYTSYGGTTYLDAGLSACWGERIQLSLSPQLAYISSVNPVSLTIENSGRSPIDNVEVAVTAQGALLLNASFPTILKIGRLEPSAKKSIPLQVVPQSSFPSLTVTLSYTDCMGDKRTSSLQVPFYATAGQSILVVPDRPILSSGQSTSVNLKVINAGNVPISNLNLILSLQKSPLSISPTMLSVGDLKPGEARTVAISVAVPTTASSSETVSYQALYMVEGGGLVSTAGSFSLYVAQTSSVSITSVDTVPQNPQAGGNIIVAVGLINDGAFPVYGVNVSAIASQGLSPLRSTYTYIGQLNPQVLTSLPFSFKAAQEGLQEVKFLVTYRDAYGSIKTAERTVLINVSPATSPGSPQQGSGSISSYFIPALGAMVIAGVVLYVAYKRRVKG
jgi:hypothetical protein